MLGHRAPGMRDILPHEAVLQVDHHQGGALRVEPREGVRRAAARGDAGLDALRQREGVHAGPSWQGCGLAVQTGECGLGAAILGPALAAGWHG